MTEAAVGHPPGDGAVRLWTDSQAAFKRRDYRQAADLMGALLRDWGEDGAPAGAAALRLSLGVTLLRLRETEAGVEQLRRAVDLAPDDARARQKLGAGLARLGRDREALAAFEQAVALRPGEAEYQWRLGEQLRRLGQARRARAAFARCLELQPDHPAAVKAMADLDRPRGWRAWTGRLLRRG